MRAASVSLLVPALAVVASCSVGDLELAGKQCPCVDDYVCDTATGTCVFFAPEALPPPVTVDGTPAPPRPPPGGRVIVSDLRATWATSNVIRWRWTVRGAADDFARYELVTGPTKEAVETRRGARLEVSPELDVFSARDRTPGAELEVWTLSEHPPNSVVFAQVTAVDRLGTGHATPVVSAKTKLDAAKELRLFSDEPVSGKLVPAELDRVQGGGYGTSTHSLRGRPACGAEPKCSVLFVYEGLGKKLPSLSSAEFNRAFAELRVRADAMAPGELVDFGVHVGTGCAASECRYRLVDFGLVPSDRYRLVQVPLSQMVRSGGDKLDLPALKASGFEIFSISVGAEWKAGSEVRFDEIKIRW